MKRRMFFENAKLLNKKFGIVPLMYGSLGLEYITHESLNVDDIDVLIPEVFLTERWNEFQDILYTEGYCLVDEAEHTFEKEGLSISYASLDGLESFAQISLRDIQQYTVDQVSFKVLSLSQYLNVYRASIKDGYRIHVRQKKDSEKIELIEKHLDLQTKVLNQNAAANRPVTTLFMLMSVDGKISTGACDELDMDQDIPQIAGVSEGLHQYYEIEQTTDLWSLNTGRVQAKMGVNTKPMPKKGPVSFVLIDNHHLNEHGIRYFCALSQKFVLMTTNKNHPAFHVQEDNLYILTQETLDLKEMLRYLKVEHGCERITIQSGGTMNGLFLREKLFDFVDIVVAPVLVGGAQTSTLIDGQSVMSCDQLNQLGVLKLQECTVLKDSYLRLRYQVLS